MLLVVNAAGLTIRLDIPTRRADRLKQWLLPDASHRLVYLQDCLYHDPEVLVRKQQLAASRHQESPHTILLSLIAQLHNQCLGTTPDIPRRGQQSASRVRQLVRYYTKQEKDPLIGEDVFIEGIRRTHGCKRAASGWDHRSGEFRRAKRYI
ncbi:MAG: hypothetical protein OHK93_006632 [Ramalina farinacea]|uniref:Uncharacterized protein n=1 Tax=Ramalina farinacea TaxID=258253 RepID=A0AA43QIX8_9LECA|nr:hypothetical protein [Ramalina farinacea]